MVDATMGWKQGRCPNRACAGGIMWVKQSQRDDELWLVRRSFDERPWIEAAPGPFCPLCADDLLPVAVGAAVEGEQDVA